jgi:hypothetical protein
MVSLFSYMTCLTQDELGVRASAGRRRVPRKMLTKYNLIVSKLSLLALTKELIAVWNKIPQRYGMFQVFIDFPTSYNQGVFS